MKSTQNIFRLTVMAAALFSAFGQAQAQDDEVNALIKPESSVSFGVGHWSEDRHQLGIYDGQRDRGAFGNADLSLVQRDDATGTWLKLDARNLGLSTRALRGEYLRQGDIGVYVEHGRTVRNNPLTFTTGLSGIGTANQTIGGTAPREVGLGTKRDNTEVGFYKSISESLALNASFQNEDKEGSRHYGLGSAAFFLVEPVNSSIQQMKLALDYTTEALQLNGGYYGSWYTNDNPLVLATNASAASVANPQGTTSNPVLVPLSQPLNNQAHQLFLDGGYNFTPTTRGAVKLSYTRATQDENLPTYDLTAPNNRFIGAPRSLDGEINTTLAQVSLSSRPLDKLSIVANLRYQDVDDQTPLAGFVGSNTTGVATVHNTPHSITTTSGKLEATYQLPMRFNLTGGVDISRQDRTYPLFEAERFVPFRVDLDEDTFRLQLRRPLSDTVSGSIAYLHSEREGSDYLITEHFTSDLINPIHIADRERDKWKLMVNWVPSAAFSLQGTFEDSRDDYGYSATRPYGLRDGSAQRYSVDASYTIGEDWNLSAWFSHDETKANQFGARWDRVTEAYELDKAYHLKDIGDSVGLGLRGKLSSALQIGADVQWTDNRSEYKDTLDTAGIGASLTPPAVGGTTARQTVALPDIQNKATRLGLFAQYALKKNSDLRLDLVHERWETDDWSWMFSNGTAFRYGGADGTTVTAQQKQVSNFVGLRYSYRFQ